MIGYRHNRPTLDSVTIYDCSTSVKSVDIFTYLGIQVDAKLNWSAHIDSISRKLNTRLYRMRKLKSFNVENKLLQFFIIL